MCVHLDTGAAASTPAAKVTSASCLCLCTFMLFVLKLKAAHVSLPQTSTSACRIPAATVAVTTHQAATGVSVALVTSSAATPVQVKTCDRAGAETLIGLKHDEFLQSVCGVSDVDECEDPLQCPGQECMNSQGSYRCVSCQPGYRLLNRLCTGEHTCVCTVVSTLTLSQRDETNSPFLLSKKSRL